MLYVICEVVFVKLGIALHFSFVFSLSLSHVRKYLYMVYDLNVFLNKCFKGSKVSIMPPYCSSTGTKSRNEDVQYRLP